MTDERKNEIWAMLTQEAITHCQMQFKHCRGDWDEGYNTALENLFGTHNLTAQAEEKPKEPNVANEPNLSNSANIGTNWNEYRLDLAREIAVTLINNSDKETRYGDILAHDAVKIANEIVKRLKETEE